MDLLQAVILGIIQGVSEFLPISSSGHLAIAQSFMKISEDVLAIDILLHLGTFFAIILAYRKAVIGLVSEFFLMIKDIVTTRSPHMEKSKYRVYIPCILIATVPAAAGGVLFGDAIEASLHSLFFIFLMLQLTAALLFAGDRISRSNTGMIENLGPVKSFVIGLFQMAALVPGLSRSGTTMTGGLVCGLKKEEALEMSFLMALPAIAGSVILEIGGVAKVVSAGVLPAAAGFLTAFVCGVGSIKLFKTVVRKYSPAVFSVYLIILGQVMLALPKS